MFVGGGRACTVIFFVGSEKQVEKLLDYIWVGAKGVRSLARGHEVMVTCEGGCVAAGDCGGEVLAAAPNSPPTTTTSTVGMALPSVGKTKMWAKPKTKGKSLSGSSARFRRGDGEGGGRRAWVNIFSPWAFSNEPLVDLTGMLAVACVVRRASCRSPHKQRTSADHHENGRKK